MLGVLLAAFWPGLPAATEPRHHRGMDIADAQQRIETFLADHHPGDVAAKEVQVRPSGDDRDAIKVWLGYDSGAIDEGRLPLLRLAVEKALQEKLPEVTAAFTLEVRLERI
jgi:hypothetical protein